MFLCYKKILTYYLTIIIQTEAWFHSKLCKIHQNIHKNDKANVEWIPKLVFQVLYDK